MNGDEREWLQRELDDIKRRIDGKPCTEHGEDIRALMTWKEDRKNSNFTARDWIRIGILIVVAVAGAAAAYAAFAK